MKGFWNGTHTPEQMLLAINMVNEYMEACARLETNANLEGFRRSLLRATTNDLIKARKEAERNV